MKEQIIKIIKQDLEFEYDYSFLDGDIVNVADKIIALTESDKGRDYKHIVEQILVDEWQGVYQEHLLLNTVASGDKCDFIQYLQTLSHRITGAMIDELSKLPCDATVYNNGIIFNNNKRYRIVFIPEGDVNNE